MSAPELFAALVVSSSVMAPALPPRTDWVGETVFVKAPGSLYGQIEVDGTFTPVDRLRSIQYVVVKDEKGRLQITQDGKPVWVNKDEMVRLKDAVDYYTKKLDEDPSNDTWFAFRGWARHRQGKTAEGIKDYGEAIRLNPAAASWYSNRGLIHLEAKQVDDAIADFSMSLELVPDNETALRNRAMAYTRKKDWTRSLADCERVLELDPDSPVSQNAVAWILCTAPDAKVRDGKRALEAAQKACELTKFKNGGYLDTLAAAYAELGQFDKAVEWQEKALKAGDIPIKDMDAARKRLELFKQKKAYRDE
jgi:tetratricopeptide (TPR) repeat protein